MAVRPLTVPMTPVKPPESLTILDWYACHAIAGIAGRTGALRDGEEAELARDAFAIAEAMIAARRPYLIASKKRTAVRLRKVADELSARGYSHDAARRQAMAATLEAESAAIESEIKADETKGETT